jgi:type VI secretion system secreted protein Hcp
VHRIARMSLRPVAAAIAILIVAGGAAAVASIPDSGGVIRGCYSTRTGVVRVVDREAGAKCQSGERALNWNQRGRRGARGADGEPGEPGAPGPQGPAGPSDATPMGAPAYLACFGETQGEIRGGATRSDVAGQVEVVSFQHEVLSPRDAASGLPTGKRQHKPLVITKPVDKSTPLYMYALVNTENLPQCTLTFFRADDVGEPEAYFTIRLTNANVAGIQSQKGDTRSVAGRLGEQETLSFTYQKIEWTYLDGGIQAEDDWESPIN